MPISVERFTRDETLALVQAERRGERGCAARLQAETPVPARARLAHDVLKDGSTNASAEGCWAVRIDLTSP